MKSPIRFETIRTMQQFEDLKQFAASDGHMITNHSILPIVTMSRGPKTFGYFHVITHPIILPAFHVNLCDPADFKEAAQQIAATYQYNSMSDRFPSGTCFIALPPEPMIDEAVVEKLGFEDCQRKLWQNTPREDLQ